MVVTLLVEMSTSSPRSVILLSILDFLLIDVIKILSTIIKMPLDQSDTVSSLCLHLNVLIITPKLT